jgi:uncharacterized protein (TIGR03067 family)
MRDLKFVAIILPVALATATLALAGDDKPDDAKQLQGTWAIDPATYKDEKDKDMREELAKLRMVFDGDTLTIKELIHFEENGKKKTEFKELKGPFHLDQTKNPKHIDLLGENEPQGQGIYELDKDKLTLCWAKDFRHRGRPEKFTDEKNRDIILMVLIREKKE